MELALFLLLAAMALASAAAVVVCRRPMHSALSFLLTLLSLAGLFLMLAAPFIAVVQLIVYAGAVLVLFLFVIMLFHSQVEARSAIQRLQPPLVIALSLLALAGVIYWNNLQEAQITESGPLSDPTVSLESLGTALLQTYALPFELSAVLLLTAVIAAVALAKSEEKGQL